MPSGDTIGFAPAFCLSKKDADIIIDCTSKSINQVINH
jgi:adenosylmethionine-8-amino-7-oxononanoate aminotransferase